MARVYAARAVTAVATPKNFLGTPIDLNAAAPTTGTFLTVSETSDNASVEGFLKGSGVMNIMSDTTGTITVTIMGGGDANEDLSFSRREQKRTGTPRVYSIMIKDANGTTVHSAPNAIIAGSPPDEFSETKAPRQWTFLCADLDMDHGAALEQD
jgi:hypothetical protein